jgi:hypothetical protein
VYSLSRLAEAVPGRDADRERYVQRYDVARRVLSARHLLEACAAVSPEGRRRDRDVLTLEQAILGCVDARGRWDDAGPVPLAAVINDVRRWHEPLAREGVL